jgi:uncharacterized SAM-binding protein YcdF (DUF218 family)
MIPVCLIAALAFGLAWVEWRRSSRVLSVLALVLFLAIGCGPVPAVLLNSLQAGYAANVSGPWGRKTAIVLLGAGAVRTPAPHGVEVAALAYGRLVKALELYLQCKQHGGTCTLIVSGGDAAGFGASEAAVYGLVLRNLGVDPADLVLEGRSMNTWQNAQFCAAWLNAHEENRVLLVTSGVHLRRSVLYFAHFGIHPTAVRADYVRATTGLLPLAYNFLVTDLAFHEYVGILRYYIYEAFGWNITAQQPGSL